MRTLARTLVLASGIALAVGTIGNASADETLSREVIDTRMETQIWTTYALSPYLRVNDLEVAVHDGKATISGVVDEDARSELASLIALGVKGVRQVDNQIVVDADYVRPIRNASGERSLGEVIDDATISAAVKSRLLHNRQTALLLLDVNTRRERVTLKGKVDSPEARGYATGVAANTRGVRSVDNRLVIDNAVKGVRSTCLTF